ncbi:MAG: glycosyltransferase family 1 protein [Candidatus Levyibacteriota bacterium]
MLIGVDAGCLGIKDTRLRVGVYTVAKNLLEKLGKLDRKNKYALYSFYPIEKSLMKSFGPNMKNIIVTPVRGWMKIWLPMKIRKETPKVFLALSQTVPSYMPFRKKPYTIGFVYDLAFEKFPNMYPGFASKLKNESRNTANVSDAILTISENSKKDLIKLYKTNVKKIHVSHPGVSKNFKHIGKKHKSKKPYFLFVGSLKRTKNVPGIIKAFLYFIKSSKIDFDLYIVGGDKWFDSEIRQVLKDAGSKNIQFLGFVNEKMLPSLYRGATAFVSPSFYEGFGLPLAEAMKSGIPVIGSNASSIPEIVGDGGILVNPKNYKEIGGAMMEVVKNSKKRKSMIKKGLKRVDNFSWDKFANDVMSLINKGQ